MARKPQQFSLDRDTGSMILPADPWAIGIYGGDSPFAFSPLPECENPVLTRRQVSDVAAAFVADPFMLRVEDCWYMFFEVMNHRSGKGEIGLATSQNGFDWEYQKIVLAEEFHLSYPYVFAWEEEIYLIPESAKTGHVRLYRAAGFPTEWVYLTDLVSGAFADSSIFRLDGRWWLLACTAPYQHDVLRLYFADELSGPWIEHPLSPLVTGDPRIARPAGRVLVDGDRVIRYAQDCYPRYGSRVRAFVISGLTPTRYVEVEYRNSPILTATKQAWNGRGMHHIDPHLMPNGRWLACVDGHSIPQTDIDQK